MTIHEAIEIVDAILDENEDEGSTMYGVLSERRIKALEELILLACESDEWEREEELEKGRPT